MKTLLQQFWTDEDLTRDPRSIQESEFPSRGSSSEKLRFLLNYAVLAPSSRNSQPWYWRESIETLHLYVDKNFQLGVSDPAEREKLIGCGASLFFLTVAMRYFGYEPRVERFPNRRETNYLASVTLGEAHIPTNEDELLFGAIMERHTNRGVFETRDVPIEILNELQMDATEYGVWLHLIKSAEKRREMVELIASSDIEQWEDADFASEMGHWIHADRARTKSGMPVRAMGFTPLEERWLPLAMRVPLLGKILHLDQVQTDRDWMLAGAAPVLAILGTGETHDAARDWLAVGEALGNILLRAAAAGLSASYFNGLVQVPHLWPKIYHIIGRRGFIQLVFRLGYPVEPAADTPRRPVAEVLRP